MGPPQISDEELVRYILSKNNLEDQNYETIELNKRIDLAFEDNLQNLPNRIARLEKIILDLEKKSIKLESYYNQIIDSLEEKTNYFEILEKYENKSLIKAQEKFENTSIPPQSYSLDGFIRYNLQGIRLKVVYIQKKLLKSKIIYIEDGNTISEPIKSINISIESLKMNAFLKINEAVYEMEKSTFKEFTLNYPFNTNNRVIIVPYHERDAKIINFSFNILNKT